MSKVSDRLFFRAMVGAVVGLLVIILALLMLYQARVVRSDSYWHVQAPYPLESERFGVGGGGSTISPTDWQALGAAWYVPWSATLNPAHPNGAAVLQTFRIKGDQSVLDRQSIVEIVHANPGGIWRVGNEPDSPWQDNATPEQYARIYHQLYSLVKSVDPHAQVAFGSLVQATPLRLLYLDHVWAAYQDFYGGDMPVDVWTLHSFILPEVGSWGAGVPPGMDDFAHLGMSYQLRDHDNMDIFTQRIVDFRQWMADHGQREKPLLIPEYGILLWPIYQDEDGRYFDDERVITFMYATFDFFLSVTDPNSGYSADNNRLVQTWAWYSLDDDVYDGDQLIGEGYGGDLYSGPPGEKTMTALGEAFAAYVQPLSGPAYTDLWPVQFQVESKQALCQQTTHITLTAQVANYGRQPAQNVQVQFWQGEPGAGGEMIGAPQTISLVPGRYEGVGEASVSWTAPAVGIYTLWLEVDVGDQVVESDESNNQTSVQVLVPAVCLFLPLAVCE